MMDGIARATRLALGFIGLLTICACSGENPDQATYDEGDGLGEGECADMCGTPGCGECPVANMVDGGGFLIAATEVSNADYSLLLEVDFDESVLPAGCEWKSHFVPDGWSDALPPTHPVVGVDWCDAAVYCAWSGQRLCGSVTGGPADWDLAEDPKGDAWYRACSNAGEQPFPYGTAYAPELCNGGDAGLDSVTAVGTLGNCQGGIPGLFDMSGNVWEWSDSCEHKGGDARTLCRRRGGSHYSDPDNLRCGVNSQRARGERDNAVGFRCCSS